MGENKSIIGELVLILLIALIVYHVGFAQGVNNQPIEGGFACPAYDNGLIDGYGAALAEYNITNDKIGNYEFARDIRSKCEKYGIEMEY